MTRETKVGIFVAASFLCLVAVVVAAKLRQVEDPEDTKALANAKITMPTPLKEGPTPAPVGDPNVPALLNTAGFTHTTPDNLVPPPPPPSSPDTSSAPVVPDLNLPAPTVPTPQPQEAVKPIVPSVPTIAESEQTQKMRELANALKPQAPEIPNFPASPPAPTVVVTEPNNTKPTAPEVPSITLQPKKTEPKTPAIEPPSVALNTQAPPVPGPVPEAPKPIEPKQVKPEIKVSGPPIGSVESFGPGGTQISDYTVKSYPVQLGDTYASISRKLYDSERYAKALHQFNRDYPLAKETVKADQPRLLPGEQVFYPPPEILQAKYTAAIAPEANPIRSSIAVGTPTGLATNPGNPNNASFVPPANVPVQTAPLITTTDSGRKYRVRETGEHILEVAQQTLGDRRRWSEIYRLNPQIRPDYPIPGGTELKLP